MERFCGSLQPSIKSRRFPWASIDRNLLAQAQLTQVKHLYKLTEELTFHQARAPDTLGRGEHSDPQCM